MQTKVGKEIVRISEKKRFSIVARARSFKHAWRGLRIITKTQHNFWVEIAGVIGVALLGAYYHIDSAEWSMLILATSAVLITETINTAFEFDIDLTSPEYHPYARDTKDVAAGAVLLSLAGAFAVGLIIFLPKYSDNRLVDIAAVFATIVKAQNGRFLFTKDSIA